MQAANFQKIIAMVGKQIMRGESLTNISMPVVVNGTISATEKFAGMMGYAPFFIEKVVSQDQVEKIKAAVCFGLGIATSLFVDMAKPFNPILGQTY